MSENAERSVWIGVVEVVPRTGCELLAPEEGAFVNFLTVAASEAEYRAKVSAALSSYRLELLGFLNIRPFTPLEHGDQKTYKIATELEQSGVSTHVRFATFHTFPRTM